MMYTTLGVVIGVFIGLCSARYVRHLVTVRYMRKNYEKGRQYKYWRM